MTATMYFGISKLGNVSTIDAVSRKVRKTRHLTEQLKLCDGNICEDTFARPRTERKGDKVRTEHENLSSQKFTCSVIVETLSQHNSD
jgi:hypothetical protein